MSWTNGTVTAITPSNSSETESSFAVTTDNQTYHARKVVLATGIRDLIPSTPGIADNWAQGIFWCPWCDGHEHADQPLGLLASLDDIASSVQEVLTLNTDIVAFVNGTDTPAGRAAADEAFPQWDEYLQLHNVTVENRTIAAVVRLADGGAAYNETTDPSLPTVPEYDLFRVDFTEGESVERAAFLASFPKEQASGVGGDLGVALYGDRLYANQSNGLLTNVAGVYAVGDANTDNSTNLPHALWSGKRAAVSLHGKFIRDDSKLRDDGDGDCGADIVGVAAVKLEKEDGQKALAAGNYTKRDVELSARELWEIMNDEPGDVFYAGEF